MKNQMKKFKKSCLFQFYRIFKTFLAFHCQITNRNDDNRVKLMLFFVLVKRRSHVSFTGALNCMDCSEDLKTTVNKTFIKIKSTLFFIYSTI